MLPKFHLIFGLILSIIIFLIFPEIGYLGLIIILMSSVLIDVDHYLFYAFTKKDLSLKNAHSWFIEKNKEAMKLSRKERLKINQIPCIFHGIETIIVIILLSFISKIFFYILIGLLFHQLLDFIWILSHNFSLKHLSFQTYNILNYKIQKSSNDKKKK